MVFIGNILYQSATKCNKTIHRKRKIRNVTSATNGLYSDFGVSFCDKLQQTFFSSLSDFFFKILSCCSLSQKHTPKSLYKSICCTCYTFSSSCTFGRYCTKNHLSHLLRFFFLFLSEKTCFCGAVYGQGQLVALCYRLIQILDCLPLWGYIHVYDLFKHLLKPFAALVTLFSLLSDFFSRFCLVAVGHRSIHQNLFIKAFVALVTLFPLLFFFRI